MQSLQQQNMDQVQMANNGNMPVEMLVQGQQEQYLPQEHYEEVNGVNS